MRRPTLHLDHSRPWPRPRRATLALLALLAPLALATPACTPVPEVENAPRSSLFVGVDVSGSFQKSGRYDDAMEFAAHYLHAHLRGSGGLERPRALFVGAIGGDAPGQTQSFHPIHDFEGKSVSSIEADLRAWFPPNDRLTDFNAFFRRAATLVKRQNLALAPITLVLLTDGVPDLGPAGGPDDPAARYRAIDLDALEYLARNVTVRVLYPDPDVAVHWERDIHRDRVRLWTVDAVVMNGWRAQLAMQPLPSATPVAATAGSHSAEEPNAIPVATASVDAAARAASDVLASELDAADQPLDQQTGAAPPTTPSALADAQPELWRWIRDNIDFRVRRSVF